MDQILNSIKQKMEKVVEVVSDDMATVRVGGANPKMVENVVVEAYGQKMRMMEVASITAPDPNQIVISPWDKGLLKAIEKGIMDSDLGIMPTSAGDIVRLVIPPLTEERRQDFVKLIKQKHESGRVMMKGVRQDGKEEIEKMKDQAGVSEDDIKRLLGELDKLTVEFNEVLDKMAADKEAEVMRV